MVAAPPCRYIIPAMSIWTLENEYMAPRERDAEPPILLPFALSLLNDTRSFAPLAFARKSNTAERSIHTNFVALAGGRKEEQQRQQ